MVQVFEDLQALLDDGMAFEALDVRHKAHTTSVMLVLARVQTVLFKMLDFSSRGHASSPSMEAIKKFPSREHSARQQQCQSKQIGSDPICFDYSRRWN
jgi:hypothetical protein